MINYLVLAIALIVASVAGYYSVIGLTTIFAGAFWPVVVMASSIEAAKVVCTSWLQQHWRTAPMLIKAYMTTAIIIVSLITSLGVFGFLSKAHTDLSANSNVSSIQIATIDQQLEIEKKRLEILLKQSEKYTGPVRRFENQINDTQNKIVELTTKKVPLLQEQNKADAEVGPLKYIAELLYNNTERSTLESAVRAVTILIVFVFDPLALVMILAANHGFAQRRLVSSVPEEQIVGDGIYNYSDSEDQKWMDKQSDNSVVIDKNSLHKM